MCNLPNTHPHSERTGQKYQKLGISHCSRVTCTPKQFASNISLRLHFFNHKSHVKAKRITWCSCSLFTGVFGGITRIYAEHKTQDIYNQKSLFDRFASLGFCFLPSHLCHAARTICSLHLAERSSSYNGRPNGLILSSRHVPRIDWRKAKKKEIRREKYDWESIPTTIICIYEWWRRVHSYVRAEWRCDDCMRHSSSHSTYCNPSPVCLFTGVGRK